MCELCKAPRADALHSHHRPEKWALVSSCSFSGEETKADGADLTARTLHQAAVHSKVQN